MNPEDSRGHDAPTAAHEEPTVSGTYRTPAAFRRALMDQLKQVAQTSRFQTTQLLAHFVYDRFLARVMGGAPDAWILKGGTSLIPRLTHARHTKDIDLWFKQSLDHAERRLTELASLDLGDYLEFTVTRKGAVIGKAGVAGQRFRIDTALGEKVLYRFTVDVVTDVGMTGVPEQVHSLTPIVMPGIEPMTYAAYPIVDHIADKLDGIMSIQSDGRPSSRYRDLVDLVLLAHERHLDAAELYTAIVAKFPPASIPTTVQVPDELGWAAGYASVAQHQPTLTEKDLQSALALARILLDPILQGKTAGHWNAGSLRWE